MKKYLSVDEINVIHIEISTLCNAACPMCARNINGFGLSEGLVERQWSKKDIEQAIVPGFKNLHLVLFCGTHGDPLTATHLLYAIERCKQFGYNIHLNTNGSLRSINWWHKLCSLLDENDKITFGIDGIETNHLYRQNTNIDKILERVKICCDSKVQVQWDFLPFKHNEHELELCKKISADLGVDFFRIRKTPRFDKTTKYPVADETGTIVRYLEPPENSELRHPDLEKLTSIRNNFGLSTNNTKSLGSKIQIPLSRIKRKSVAKKENIDYDIECVYKKENRIYVNSDLVVFPCCYISDENENIQMNSRENEIKIPFDELSLRTSTWEEILSTKFYNNDFVESFTDKNKTLSRCIRTCGIARREENQNQVVISK